MHHEKNKNLFWVVALLFVLGYSNDELINPSENNQLKKERIVTPTHTNIHFFGNSTGNRYRKLPLNW